MALRERACSAGVLVLGGCRGDGDVGVRVEGSELVDEVPGAAVGVGLAGVPAGLEVGEPGLGVGEQVPDDECDTRSHMLRVSLADWRASMT